MNTKAARSHRRYQTSISTFTESTYIERPRMVNGDLAAARVDSPSLRLGFTALHKTVSFPSTAPHLGSWDYKGDISTLTIPARLHNTPLSYESLTLVHSLTIDDCPTARHSK